MTILTAENLLDPLKTALDGLKKNIEEALSWHPVTDEEPRQEQRVLGYWISGNYMAVCVRTAIGWMCLGGNVNYPDFYMELPDSPSQEQIEKVIAKRR